MSLYEFETFWIPEWFNIHWEITSFVIVFCLFRIIYNTEFDLDSMTTKEKINHYLCLIVQVIIAFYLAFLPYLNLTKL